MIETSASRTARTTCMVRVLSISIMVIGINLWAQKLYAQASLLSKIRREGLIKIGTTADYRPFTYRNLRGKLVGVDIRTMKKFAHSIGVRPAFVITSWASMMRDFKDRKFDLIAGGVTVDASRSAYGKFSQSYISDGKRPIVRCADRDRYVAINKINRPDVRVIVNTGGTNEQFARNNLGNSSLRVFSDNMTIFDHIANGDADVMVTDGTEVDLQSKLHPKILCPANVSHPFTHFDKAYLMRRDDELNTRFSAFLQNRLDNGTWARDLRAAEK